MVGPGKFACFSAIRQESKRASTCRRRNQVNLRAGSLYALAQGPETTGKKAQSCHFGWMASSGRATDANTDLPKEKNERATVRFILRGVRR
jgi:hypothetical protein